jgi:hypothetical protein
MRCELRFPAFSGEGNARRSHAEAEKNIHLKTNSLFLILQFTPG